ncbi:MAG TPA: apolipoprotein N-acyltransferase [Kiritimatiellia bacterium]|nr:apolipoprotein N-acyltransferase [Kiritimatiellia bacterium]HRZ11875.1 apolipoprotein N-acyltransferase [Kiritimatiellia bacterium]HSA17319.1 apolipoprotein N-acyltransferase [Kiritimatiellia bacterium]
MNGALKEKLHAALPRAGAAASGLLLFAAFPPLEWRNAAWVALAPLLLAARFVSVRRAAFCALLAGALFWLASIAWLTRVTVVGWIILALYSALYFVPPAVLMSAWSARRGVRSGWSNLALMLLLAATWTGAEYLRATLFTGWPWNPLGATQYANLPLIQLARGGGVYAVSALVVWVNAALALTILRYLDVRGHWGRRPHPELMLGFLAVALAVVYGWRSVRADRAEGLPLRVAVIQPNIPQDEKWTAEKFEMIYGRLRTLTEQALRVGGSDLVVWPETAVPDDIRDSEASYGLAVEMVTNGAPLLVGSMDTEWLDEGPRYYNSSFLFDTNGMIVKGYDKRHLVIFGEYVPLQPFLPFVRALTPIQASFSPGHTSTVFRLDRPDVPFSALICFEDTVAPLAAESVRNGARVLFNQTNDAWFDPGWAPKQHMIQCVFRSVENAVPSVRCANTGISCFIDRRGRVHDVLDDGNGFTRVMGIRAAEVRVPPEDMPLTFYTRHGDLFAQACAGFGALALFFALRRGRDAGKKSE